MSETRRDTRTTAFDLLVDKLRTRVASIDDPDLSAVLSEDLLRQLFDIAWEHQFDSERTPFRRETKSLVQDAISLVVDSDED